MQECWSCGFVIKADPVEYEDQETPELVCPKCQTTHYYEEDDMGNLRVSEAVRSDGRVLHVH